MTDEIWADIPHFPGYQVSTHGRINRTERTPGGKPPKMIIDYDKKRPRGRHNAYHRVKLLREDGERIERRVHKIVADAFLPPPPSPDHVITHIDYDRHRNVPENLMWVTRTENRARRQADGALYTRPRHHYSRISPFIAERIRQAYATGEYSLSKLAKEYNVHHEAIRRIVNGDWHRPKSSRRKRQ